VDPIAQGIPHYAFIIEKPMDFATLRKKVDSHVYHKVNEFYEDTLLIFYNAFRFNPMMTDVFKGAKALQEYFIKLFKEAYPSHQDPHAIQLSNQDQSLCEMAVKELEKDVEMCLPFLYPVNKQDLPVYYEVIQHPMDLGQIRYKLERGDYATVDAFIADVDLMLNNCKQFNPPESIIYEHGEKLRRAFAQIMGKRYIIQEEEKAATKTVSLNDSLQKCHNILKRVMKHGCSAAFLHPVDPIALGIPHYFDIIKRPMDLGTVKKKLLQGDYIDSEAFFKDVKLVFANCFTFNPPGA
jgi:transcription initiation factor TFIID subunit 2